MNNLALDLAFDSEKTQVELWKQELSIHLIEFTAVLDKFKHTNGELEDFISLRHNIDLCTITRIREVFNSWIERRCDIASKNANNVSHLTVTVENLPKSIGKFCYPSNKELRETYPNFEKKRLDSLSNGELVEVAINTYDFEGLEKTLAKLSSEVEDKGFRDSAYDLGLRFGLLNIHEQNDQSVKIKKQKGRYILEVSNSGRWNFERKRWIEALVPACKTFEAESEINGLKACIDGILAEEDKTVLDKTVPSKTKVCEGAAVEAMFFNGKIKLYLKPEVFEGLISYIGSYSKKPLKTIES